MTKEHTHANETLVNYAHTAHCTPMQTMNWNKWENRSSKTNLAQKTRWISLLFRIMGTDLCADIQKWWTNVTCPFTLLIMDCSIYLRTWEKSAKWKKTNFTKDFIIWFCTYIVSVFDYQKEPMRIYVESNHLFSIYHSKLEHIQP